MLPSTESVAYLASLRLSTLRIVHNVGIAKFRSMDYWQTNKSKQDKPLAKPRSVCRVHASPTLKALPQDRVYGTCQNSLVQPKPVKGQVGFKSCLQLVQGFSRFGLRMHFATWPMPFIRCFRCTLPGLRVCWQFSPPSSLELLYEWVQCYKLVSNLSQRILSQVAGSLRPLAEETRHCQFQQALWQAAPVYQGVPKVWGTISIDLSRAPPKQYAASPALAAY